MLFPGLAAVFAAATSDIQSLNSSTGGKVRAIEPFALPCFSLFEGKAVERDEALCAERQENNTNPLYRTDVPGAYMYDFSSINASDPASQDQCLLDYNDPTNAAAWEGKDCRLGNLPSYYIEVQEANDVVEALKFSKETGVRLTIKNSGHSYVEDSTGKGSLLLWTRKLQKTSYDANFIPEGCPSGTSYDAITIGAGINCGEAYEYADSVSRTILCGYSPSVGLSGGWVQGAGHSVLTNVYGLGADRAVQFTVVTPDGEVRVANECQDTDLFWALRGGGGGTYGVVLDSTHKTEAPVPMGVAQISVSSHDGTIGDFMELLVDTAIDLAEDGWGGHIYGDHIVYVSPLKTTVEEAKASLAKITEFSIANGGTSNITTSPTWYSFFRDVVLTGSYAVGNLNLIGTQLAPTSLFANDVGKQTLKDWFREQISLGAIPYIPVDSPYLAQKSHKANSSAVLPAWYNSLWEIGVGGQWQWNSTLDERKAIIEQFQKGTVEVQQLTLGGAAYKNEANPFTTNWKEVWYGETYDALLSIKNKYDPHGLLRCWGCVGWSREDGENTTYSAFMDITG